MNIQEKYKAIGEAVMKEYVTHGSKEITVTVVEKSLSDYLFISINKHSVAIFSERELKKLQNTHDINTIPHLSCLTDCTRHHHS